MSTTNDSRSNDIFRVELRAPGRDSLGKLLQNGALDFGPIQSLPSGEVIIDLFLNHDQIDQLEKTGWKLQVFENMSAAGRDRQMEVGAGDRFQGGKTPPKGLGKKTNEER